VTIREVGLALHEELDRREKLIAALQEECGAIRTTLTIVERGGSTPEAQNRVTRVVGRGRPKKAKVEGGGVSVRLWPNLQARHRFCESQARLQRQAVQARRG
jgi:hypothetical protein